MATHAIETFNLERIVSKPTWKEVLLDLIESKTLDPWNIDIIQIADAYIKKIKEMEKLNLIIPANIILAASILLRYKSDYLRIQTEPEVIIPLEGEGDNFEEIPQLELNARIPPKRQITIEELIGEMEKIIKYENAPERLILHKGGMNEFVNIALKGFDIEKKMEEIFQRIKSSVDEEGWTVFSRINDKKERIEIIYTLMSLLHLTQKKIIDIKQDEIFGEIFIALLKRDIV